MGANRCARHGRSRVTDSQGEGKSEFECENGMRFP